MEDTARITGIQLLVPSGNKQETLLIFNVYAPSTHGNLQEVVNNFWIQLEQHQPRYQKDKYPLWVVTSMPELAIDSPTPLAMQNISDSGEMTTLMKQDQECYI
jgi:hypothetical protein